jgi:uracil-DNA glycosylase family 4
MPRVVSAGRRDGEGGPDRRVRLAAIRAVQERIVTCEACPRLRRYCADVAREKRRAFRDETYWGRPVPGFGDPHARLLLVGLAPAAHGANRTGRAFTGDGAGGAGDFLMAALHRARFASIPTSRHRSDGLVLRDAFITMAVRCAPPANEPTSEELARCLPHLDAEAAALPDVRVVVALGRIAFAAYFRLLERRGARVRPCPAFGHGIIHRASDGPMVVGCYHPSRQNTQTGKLTARMMDDVLHIARAAMSASGRSLQTAGFRL